MTLVEVLVAAFVVSAAAVGACGVLGVVGAARGGVEEDVVGGYAVDGFLEEALARRGVRVPEIRRMRLGRARWVQRFVRDGSTAGPLMDRRVRVEGGRRRVAVTARFDGWRNRTVSGDVLCARGPT